MGNRHFSRQKADFRPRRIIPRQRSTILRWRGTSALRAVWGGRGLGCGFRGGADGVRNADGAGGWGDFADAYLAVLGDGETLARLRASGDGLAVELEGELDRFLSRPRIRDCGEQLALALPVVRVGLVR